MKIAHRSNGQAMLDFLFLEALTLDGTQKITSHFSKLQYWSNDTQHFRLNYLLQEFAAVDIKWILV